MTAEEPAPRGRRLPGTWWGLLLIIAVPVVALAAAAIAVLLLTVHPADATDRIELIKAGLGVGAGTGGVVALLLTGRRQWATEDANRVTEHDATERRATELYAKAAEQLGSDHAPVRLAGLYALERLADTHPTQRQTVANLLCAYLRMPFDHRGEPADADGIPPATMFRMTAAHRQEREVRLAGQAILTAHLTTDARLDGPITEHWDWITVDLTGATLIDFDLQYGLLAAATFRGATFVGGAEFSFTTFAQHAVFREATFLGGVGFRETTFGGPAFFGQAAFQGRATFIDAEFGHQVYFTDATFAGKTFFSHARFTTDVTQMPGVQFNHARFDDAAYFDNLRVTRTPATFNGTSFATVTFDHSAFAQGAIGLSSTSATNGITVADATSEGHPLALAATSEAAENLADLEHTEDLSAPG